MMDKSKEGNKRKISDGGGEEEVKSKKKTKKGSKEEVVVEVRATEPVEGKKKKTKRTKGEETKDVVETAQDNREEAPAQKKRRKKKDKKKKANPEHVHESKGQGKALHYLEVWSNDRGTWKFEKCRQIWLLQNGYDADKVPDDKFDDLLRYMGSIRGRMREVTLENAKQHVELDEKWQKLIEEGKMDAEIASILSNPKLPPKKLERAKEIVEMLS